MAQINLTISNKEFEETVTSFEPVPEGEYLCTIYSIEGTEVKSGENAGKPRLNVQYRIQNGEEAPDGTHQGNRRLFDGINAFPGKNRKTGEATQPFQLIGLAKALGLTAEDLANADTSDWVGEELYVKVGHKIKQEKIGDKYVDSPTGEMRDFVKSVRSVESAETASTAKATVTAKAGGKAKTYDL